MNDFDKIEKSRKEFYEQLELRAKEQSEKVYHEPVIHLCNDKLPEDHDFAFIRLLCTHCNDDIHAFNNESMQAWIETGKGNFCIPCFADWIEKEIYEPEEWELKKESKICVNNPTSHAEAIEKNFDPLDIDFNSPVVRTLIEHILKRVREMYFQEFKK